MGDVTGVGARRLCWAVALGVLASCGSSGSSGPSSATTPSSDGGGITAQACTTSTAAPLPSSALQYDARPNPPVNLLQNGDAETGSGNAPASWRVDAAPAGATLSWDTARVVSGTHALLIATTAAGRAAWAQDVGSVEAGLRYRLRANVFASDAGAGTHALEIFWLDGGGGTVGHDVLQSSTAGNWAEVDGFVTAPSGSAKARVAVGALAPGQYSFDDVMLVTAEPDPIPIAGGFPLGIWAIPIPGAVKNPDLGLQGAPGQPLAWQRSLASGNATFSWSGDGSSSSANLEIDCSTTCDARWFQNVDIDPRLQYELQATLYVTTIAVGSHAVEVTWRDNRGQPIGTSAITAQATGTSSSASPVLQPPQGSVMATVAFRATQPGTYRAQAIRLVAAPGSAPLFDATAAGFGFATDARSQLPRAVPILPGMFPPSFGSSIDLTSPSSILAAANDHGTALWFVGDELAWQPPQMPPQQAVNNYRTLKAAGGPAASLPAWLNHAPRGPIDQPTNYSLLLPYSAAADIVSMDVYPVPALGHAALPNEGPWSVGEYVDILRNDAASWGGAQRNVLWMVLQGFDWWEHTDKRGGDHALTVEWRDGGGRVLGSDAVGADRTNEQRTLVIDGMIPPAGAVQAVVKAAAYKPGAYTFDQVVLAEQGGTQVIAPGSTASFPTGTAPAETILGTATIQSSRRYTLSGRILAQTRPTLQESRFMAWDAIVHGARGLSWWGFNYVSETDGLLADISTVAKELRGLSTDLLARRSLREVHSSEGALEATLFSGPDGQLLVVANRTASSVSGTVGFSGPAASTITRVGEQCALRAGINVFQDEFGPLAVHLYRVR